MAYQRDADRSTRGPGAIAAWDRSSGVPGKVRRQRRIDGARATRRRDRVMAAVAGGALGRINLELDGQHRVAGGTPAAKSTPPLIKVAPVTTTSTGIFKPPVAILVGDPGKMALIPKPLVLKPPATYESPPLIGPSPIVTATIEATTTSAPSAPASSGMSSGSGSVSVTGGKKPPVSIDSTAIAPLPDVQESTEDRTWWWLGGAALALYLLTRGRT